MIKLKDVVKRYNLPIEIKYCKKCTISNQRPRITFDEQGVCSACRYAEYKHSKIDWKLREKELKDLCDHFRRKDGYYDVIVPSSGGKDSSSVAHKMKYKYGMNPLTVTWAPHLYTDIGWKNFQAAIHIGGLDNILGTPNGVIHRKLTKLSFEILGDPFQPFIYGQTNFPLQTAVRYKIPLLMYGENGEVEYGGDMKNAFIPTRDYRGDHVKHYFSGIAPEDLTQYGIDKKDLIPYLAPSIEELEVNKTEIHFFGYYEKWTPQENYYYCVENTGFTANPVRSEGTYSKYASLDDKLDGYHYYLAFIKFGLGRATSESAHEIRDGHITREEGVGLVRKFDGEFPKKNFKEFLEYCDITEEFFREVIDSWRSPHLWEKVNDEWRLKYQIS
ncbi:MAG: LPS biosynthesis protein [Candidatus Schekmanbacteria bacterium RBG_16_38_10]|uniref:LPS biosynthesis protein n=1 Tax=Candidatus Schekmanbacteria bacterium RBG_16_38_10 TaxID=1817879 RepID=A0A1F7RS21_9BACT|nr:MAG: LPS biosynthesis protein [Candidatus Schekmanbacteria bacterium RBG_16_38_10]